MDPKKADQDQTQVKVKVVPSAIIPDKAVDYEAPRELVKQPGGFVENLGKNQKLIILSVAGVILIIAAVFAFTPVKWSFLGLFVKGQQPVTVLDSKTKQPLPDAQVSLGDKTVITDVQGHADLSDLKLGKTQLTVSKKAYRTDVENVLISSSHQSGKTVYLLSTGVQISFKITDKISGQPIKDAEITLGDNKAVTTADGSSLLSLLPEHNTKKTVTVKKDGYNDGSLEIPLSGNPEPYQVALVPAGKVYFLSNRSGRIDLYQSDLDGGNQVIMLAGTGKEDQDTGVLPSVTHPDRLAVVSSREGKRDKDGVLIHDLYLFNTGSRQLTKIDGGVNFYNFRAWLGDNLVYEKYHSSTCADVKEYSLGNSQINTLVAGSGATCPNIKTAIGDRVFYSISTADTAAIGFWTIRTNGSGQQRLSDIPADNVVRQAKDTLLYEHYTNGSSWQSLDLNKLAVTRLQNGPSIENNRSYVDSPGGQHTAFIEERDGKSELYITDSKGGGETKLTSVGSVNQFVQWYGDDYVVYSSTKSDENALYIASLKGGQPTKVTDFYRGNTRTYGGGYNPYYNAGQ